MINDLTPGRLNAALEGAREDRNDAWRQTTYLAHVTGAHGKQSLQQVWQQMGLVERGTERRKPTQAELQDRMRKAEEIYAKAKAERERATNLSASG